MQAVLLRLRKFTLTRVICFVTLPPVCCVLMCLTWLVNNDSTSRQRVINDLSSSIGRLEYARDSDASIVITSPQHGGQSKYTYKKSNVSITTFHKIRLTSTTSTVPREFHFTMRSYNKETKFDRGFVLGINTAKINVTPFHKIQNRSATSADSAIPREFRFKMRSENKEAIIDQGFASGISPECLKRDYGNLADWPTASIIITFCDNELLSDILHTLHSIIQRTPQSLIKEILLIADNTTKDDFKQPLDNYCKAVFGDKVRIYRTTVTRGLIQARLMAARMATGDVLVMLDAHMEVQEKWLESLLYEIKKDRKIMATITMDWMIPTENGGWVYRYAPGNFVCYFDWDLVFGYSWPSAEWNKIYMNDSTIPLPSPCSVGNWAMDKSFFIEIGELDQGMEMWGGENLDLAIRAWLFGGRSVQIPCSHAAHQERPHQRDYRDSWIVHKYRNYKRLVEVWFDSYKKYFYQAYPQLMALNPGDISSRFELKKKAKHNFAWYHKHVYPQLGLYDVNSLAYGQLQSVNGLQCMYYEGMNSQVKMAACRDTNTTIFLSQSGVLRMGAAVVLTQNLQEDAKLTYGEAIHFLDVESLAVWVHWKGGPIKVVGHDLCLEYGPTSGSVVLKVCDPCNENQRWRWQMYTPLYGLMLKSINSDVNDNQWNKMALKEIHSLRKSWPSVKLLRNKSKKPSGKDNIC